ncbi:hypothetical protein EJB05_24810, partial [Eragrostis curvula]
MADERRSKKMRILMVPFFATSHIGPFTDLAVRLATARPGVVEPTVAVTPANVPVVRSALARHGPAASGLVGIATYPFPAVDGLPPGVENLSAAGADDACGASTPPPESAPDAVVTDFHFFWNSAVAAELRVPCVTFSIVGPFASLAMGRLTGAAAVVGDDGQEEEVVAVPGFHAPEIRIPVAELPEFLRRRPAGKQQQQLDGGSFEFSPQKQ